MSRKLGEPKEKKIEWIVGEKYLTDSKYRLTLIHQTKLGNLVFEDEEGYIHLTKEDGTIDGDDFITKRCATAFIYMKANGTITGTPTEGSIVGRQEIDLDAFEYYVY